MEAAAVSSALTEKARASLSLEDVAVARAGQPIIAGVTVKLDPGEAIIFKGPNGSGKTTLLRAIAGLLPISSGRITLRVGGDVATSAAERRVHVVHCGHLDGVKAQLTVAENLAFWAKLYGSRRGVAAALQRFDLAALSGAGAGVLSAGQRRRLSLARVAVSGRPIWRLDEPTASMDAVSAARLVDLIADHRKDGGAVIIATHDRIAVDGARAYVLEAAAR